MEIHPAHFLWGKNLLHPPLWVVEHFMAAKVEGVSRILPDRTVLSLWAYCRKNAFVTAYSAVIKLARILGGKGG